MTRRHSGSGSKAQITREVLLRAGEDVFSERGYHAASVSEICLQSGVANGTFYRYFENKNDIFATLVERLQTALCARIDETAKTASSADEAILRAVRDVLSFAEHESALYRVGRSAESMEIGIHRHFRANLAEALGRLIQWGIDANVLRAVDPSIAAYALLGIIEFAIMRYVLWEPGALSEKELQALDTLILRGIDTGKPMSEAQHSTSERHSVRSAACDEEQLHGGEATRRALLVAAEQLFGEAGFHRTAISGITYLAGVAQGTFYLHFPSKVAVFIELVREINRRFRDEERTALTGLVDRREIEQVGFRTFFRFIGMHRGAYRILREAELVDPQTGRWYYERLAEGYVRGLQRGVDRGEIRPLALEPLAYALLGMGHSVALRTLTEAGDDTVSDTALHELIGIVAHGLGVSSR